MTGVAILPDSPLRAPVLALLRRHLDLMWASSPPESVHALDPGALAGPGVDFFTLAEGEALLGMGAIKRIDRDHAEIKSMHVVAEARSRGLAQQMLDHLMDHARACGYARLSLETGVQDAFAAARA
ncbi:MAG: GNAT family N-acetyltransferase, partial [Chloroflexi bacterium]|nr:GNAT family N-acetyltransferase [Chloroflexota bacterium]